MRKPVAISNWKMAMTIAQGQAFVHAFQPAAASYLDRVEVILCPPLTAIWAVAEAITDRRIQLAGQNLADTNDPARMGQVSASLLADAGCRYAVLGHWEVRRCLGDDDASIARKLRMVLNAGLRPILLIGEPRGHKGAIEIALERQLVSIVGECGAHEINGAVFVYEPEAAIGALALATTEQVAAGCGLLRRWLRTQFGGASEQARIMYGGGVAPEYASQILACADVDGIGATRRGRDAASFVEIMRSVAETRGEAISSGQT
jgi:triosephosphate isomerase